MFSYVYLVIICLVAVEFAFMSVLLIVAK